MSDIIVDRDHPVEMADGVRLATDIYRPDDDTAHPVLVHRNPYDKSNAKSVGGLILNPLDAVENGFVVVVQDVRGRFASNGEWRPFRHEREDGYQTVEWAAEQPWSDGHVGIYGASYHGVTALQAAAAAPPHLDAVFAYSTGCNYHHGFVYESGAFNLGFCLYWALGLAKDEIEDTDALAELDDVRSNPDEYVTQRPLTSIFPTESVATYWQTWLDHPEYDEYWRDVDVSTSVADIDCPVFHLSGWYDIFLQGHLDLEERLREAGPEHHRFVVGPWDHEAYTTLTPDKAGDRVFGPDAATGTGLLSELAFDWFDRWLTDEPEVASRQSVRYFQMGRNEWCESDEWPPEHDPYRFYLHGKNSDETASVTGALSRAQPESDRPPASYRYDPDDPVPSCGGRLHQPIFGAAGVRDQSPILEREDVLVYTSARLTDPLDVAGPIKCLLHIACSQPDTDLVATLIDFEPSGYRANIADGILRARYRETSSEPHYLEPETEYAVTVDMGAVAHTFAAGHRVGLAVTSSDFPRFDRNPNARGPIADAPPDAYQPADIRVFHDSNRPSHLVLPILNE